MSEPLDLYTSALREEGKLDSQGRFTIDPGLALRKLQGSLLQLEDSLLYLVQSAVASGATKMNVETAQGEILVSHNGFWPGLDDVTGALQWALEPGEKLEKVASHRFGLAIAAALSLPGLEVRVEYSSGPAISFQSARVKIENSGCAKNRLRFTFPQSWWQKIFASPVKSTVRRLGQRARFAPLVLRLNESTISGVEFGLQTYCHGGTGFNTFASRISVPNTGTGDDDPIVYHDHHSLEVRFLGAQEKLNLPSSQAGFMHTVGSGDCWAALAMRIKGYPKLEVVQYGVSLKTPLQPKLPYLPKLWILLADNQLSTDLSFLRLVVNAEVQEKVQKLQAQFTPVYEKTREMHKRKGTSYPWELWLSDVKSLQ